MPIPHTGRHLRLRLGAAFCAGLFLATGCRQNTDLAAVDAMAKAAAASRPVLGALTDDFRDSCLRTVEWERIGDPAGAYDPAAVCRESTIAARQWRIADDVVTGYVAALGALAGSGDGGDFGLSDLATSLSALSSTKLFDRPALTSAKGQASAISALLAKLLAGGFAAKRRDVLAGIMGQADIELAGLIATLEDAARTNYATELDTEGTQVQKFFLVAVGNPAGPQRFLAVDERLKESAAFAVLDHHRSAIDDYVLALERIKSAHHEIVAAVAADDPASIAGIVRTFIVEYEPAIEDVRKAFP